MQPDAGFGVGVHAGCGVHSLRISKSARRRGYAGAIITANASRASQTLPMHRKLCHDRLCGTPGLSPTAAASAPGGKMTLQFLFKALASLLRDLFFFNPKRVMGWRQNLDQVKKYFQILPGIGARSFQARIRAQNPPRSLYAIPFPPFSVSVLVFQTSPCGTENASGSRPPRVAAGILLWFSSEKKQGAANAVSADLPRPAKVPSAARPAQAEAVRGQSRRIIFTGPRSPDSESFSSEAKPE